MWILTVDARNGKVSHWHAIYGKHSPDIFEGFTAIVNKVLTAKYEKLVSRASELIKVLPWGEQFEVDVFRKPDFTGKSIPHAPRVFLQYLSILDFG
jgi:Peptidase family M49